MLDIWDGSETDTYYLQRKEIMTNMAIQKKVRATSDLDKVVLAISLLTEAVEELYHRVETLEKGEIHNEIQKNDDQGGNEA